MLAGVPLVVERSSHDLHGSVLPRVAIAASMGIEPRASLAAFWSECERIEQLGGTPSTPFWQLLHMSDNEGCLGTAVCRALHVDFERFAERAASHLDVLWRQGYTNWRGAVGAAAESGGWLEFR